MNEKELFTRNLYKELKLLLGTHITKEEISSTLRIISLPDKLKIIDKLTPFIGISFSQEWFDENIVNFKGNKK